MSQSDSSIVSSSAKTDVSRGPADLEDTKTPRSFDERPVVKLSVRLLETFNSINEKYYAKRKAARQERYKVYNVAAKSKLKSGSKPKNEVDPSIAINPVEKDCNYIVKNSERLQGRYVVTPLTGARSALIGKGSFGKVVSAWDEVGKEFVAIKIVKRKASFFEQAQVEIEILQSLRDSDTRDWNIVEMKGHFLHDGHQCIVFELLQHNLYEVLQYTRFEGLNLKLVRVLARQLLRTLHYLGSRVHGRDKEQVIHCDLKPENILLRKPKKTKIKVIDFGSACFRSYKPHQYIQSRFYRAPEVLFGCPYGIAVDMFSVGCILFELHTGRPLFDGANESEQVDKQLDVLGFPSSRVLAKGRKVEKYFYYDPMYGNWHYRSGREIPNPNKSIEKLLGKRYDTANEDSVQFVALVKAMLEWDADERITPADALRHPFFAAYVDRMMAEQASTASVSAAAAVSAEKSTSSMASTSRSSSTTNSRKSSVSSDGGGNMSDASRGLSDGDMSASPVVKRLNSYHDMTTQTPAHVVGSHGDGPMLESKTVPLQLTRSTQYGYSSGSDCDVEYQTVGRRPQSQPFPSKHRDTRGVSPKRHLEQVSAEDSKDSHRSHKRSRHASVPRSRLDSMNDSGELARASTFSTGMVPQMADHHHDAMIISSDTVNDSSGPPALKHHTSNSQDAKSIDRERELAS